MNNVIKLSAIAAVSSALFVGGVALACDGHEHKGGDTLTQLDTNKDGKVSQPEVLAAWTARFDAADTNKDGTVSDAERTAARAAHMDERLSALDTNKNGSIEQSEAKGPLAHFFSAVDADKSGSLSKAEITAHRAQFQKDHPRGDHGRKEPTTKQELSALVSEHFKRMDKNGDGALTGDELQHHGRRGGFRHGEHGRSRDAG
jgi:Ca2+-binding EF-hand superfamily protein